MWLILQSAYDTLLTAISTGVVPPFQDQQAYAAGKTTALGQGNFSDIMEVAGDTARIHIKGILTNEPSLMAFFFGGGNTTYPEIIAALAAAEKDPKIKKAELFIKSPGGIIEGGFEAMSAIRNFAKPITARIDGVGASMAYAFASQTLHITAAHNATQVGSVGIAQEISIPENLVILTSTAAPKKRPDVRTEQGKKDAVEFLDSIHGLFAQAIAEGRTRATGKTVTVDMVNSNFGQGAAVLGIEALNKGMVDVIESDKSVRPVLKVVGSKGNDNIGGNKAMTLDELKAQHPALYAAAVGEGVHQGVVKERDRVNSHLIMGSSSGDMKTAMEAIKAGTEMTGALQATYLAAGMNRTDKTNRQAETTALNPGGGNAPAGGGAPALSDDEKSDQVLALVAKGTGYTVPVAANAGGIK